MLACETILWNSENYESMIRLRNQCLRIPLGMSIVEADRQHDKKDILIGGFLDHTLVACCILKNIDEHTFKLRQMAVSPLLQSKGLGKQIVDYAHQIALAHCKAKIILEARYSAIPFYEKSGYQSISSMYVIIGIPHVLMEKKILPIL